MDKSSPLYGKRVLVTRPEHQSEPFARSLKDAGAHAILAPVIAFAPPGDVPAAERAVRGAAEYAWIVFTSANGVTAFFELMDARFPANAKIAVIGSGTAAALRARGLNPDLIPQSYVAEDLAQALIAATKPGDRILVFRAQEARDVLPEMLRASERLPEVVAAYKTVTVRDTEFAQKVAQCDILTFTSASTVRGFAENVADPVQAAKGKTVACIGPITAQAARALGLNVDVVATTFTANGLCDALMKQRP